MDDALELAGVEPSPWGDEYTDPETNAAVAEVVEESANGSSQSIEYYDDEIWVGPELWSYLVGIDASLMEHVEEFALDEDEISSLAPMSVDVRVFAADDRVALLDSPAYTGLCTSLSSGTVRAATGSERKACYGGLSHPDPDLPMSVVDSDDVVLVVDIINDGTAGWIELVSE